ncbi:MAG: hypothetical protein L3J36_02880 [Rhodobacteraceae bacterium]|nr:hypothetical protein [Paracoccaceae bacterium]
MRKPLMLLLTTSLFLTACGWREARLNPSNWFGTSKTVAVEAVNQTNPLIPQRSALRRKRAIEDTSVVIAKITELRINKTPTGAIILATGIATRQGAFNAELRADEPDSDDPGATSDVLSYTFRITYPGPLTATGTEHTRTISVAQSLSNQELRKIRLIRVQGAQNTIESRRR